MRGRIISSPSPENINIRLSRALRSCVDHRGVLGGFDKLIQRCREHHGKQRCLCEQIRKMIFPGTDLCVTAPKGERH